MRHLGLAAGFIVASTSLAHATGGLSCEIDDDNLRFSFAAVKSHGRGDQIFDIKVLADIKVAGVPQGLRKPDLAKPDNLVHSWVYEDEARLLFYKEARDTTGGLGTVTLVILTKASDEPGLNKGEYWLSISVPDKDKPIELTGKVVCDIE